MLTPMSAADDVARDLLTRTGGRITQARLTALSSLLAFGRAAPPTDLHRLAPDMDRVSLYRALDWLTDQGLARRLTDADGVRRYEPAVPGADHHHPHFQCTRCHQTTCVEIDGALSVRLPAGFTQEGIEVLVKGLCRTCGLVSVPLTGSRAAARTRASR